MVVRFVAMATCRIVYHHCLNFLFIIIVNLITKYFVLFLDVNEYRDDHLLWNGYNIRRITL